MRYHQQSASAPSDSASSPSHSASSQSLHNNSGQARTASAPSSMADIDVKAGGDMGAGRENVQQQDNVGANSDTVNDASS